MAQKNYFRNVVSLILTLVLIASFAVNIKAATPRWANIHSISLVITFDGSNGNASGVAIKQSTETKIEGTLYLYELIDDDWEYIDEWYNSKTRGTLGVSGDFTCESGVTYKAVFVVTAYTGTTSETETVEYIDTCP